MASGASPLLDPTAIQSGENAGNHPTISTNQQTRNTQATQLQQSHDQQMV